MRSNFPEQKIFDSTTKLEAEFTYEAADLALLNNELTSTAHGFRLDDLVQLTTTDTLPAGLSASTDYFVVKIVSANKFKISATKGGEAVEITDDGTGTHSFHLKGRKVLVSDFRNIGLSHYTANSANLTIKFQGSNQEDVDFNSAVSETNRWDYIQVKDLEDQSTIDGDTGVSPAGTDEYREFEMNTNGLVWVNAVITTFTAGTTHLGATLFND